MNPNDENEIIGPRKSNEVRNSPWECRVNKRDEKAQRKQRFGKQVAKPSGPSGRNDGS